MTQMIRAKNLISIEGIDGSGKSTFIKSAEHWYDKVKDKFLPSLLVTKTPNPDHRFYKEIREDLSKNDIDLNELLKNFLVNMQDFNYKEVLAYRPTERIVISDRHIDSTLSYQGLDFDISQILMNMSELSQFAKDDGMTDIASVIFPSLTVFLDVSVETAIKRLSDRAGTSERYEDVELMRKIRTNYINAFRRCHPRAMILDTKKKNLLLATYSSDDADYVPMESTPYDLSRLGVDPMKHRPGDVMIIRGEPEESMYDEIFLNVMDHFLNGFSGFTKLDMYYTPKDQGTE